LTPSTETLGLSVLRKLNLETLKEEVKMVTSIVPTEVADYLLNNKRKEILDLELRRHLSIVIERDATMIPGESKIICGK
jgi:ribonuclease E